MNICSICSSISNNPVYAVANYCVVPLILCENCYKKFILCETCRSNKNIYFDMECSKCDNCSNNFCGKHLKECCDCLKQFCSDCHCNHINKCNKIFDTIPINPKKENQCYFCHACSNFVCNKCNNHCCNLHYSTDQDNCVDCMINLSINIDNNMYGK